MSGIIRTLPKVSILDKPLSKARSEVNNFDTLGKDSLRKNVFIQS